MKDDGKKYVVYGMKAKCSEGSMENYISTDVGHGVLYQGQPLLNANDHTPQVNLTHFGDCHSKKIYEEAKKQADEKYKADADDGFFEKAGKLLAKTVTKAAISVKENFCANKCELDTPLPWMFVNKEHMIDGAPALTVESQCACRYGGIITIVPEPEEEVTIETEEVALAENMAEPDEVEVKELEKEKNKVRLSAGVGWLLETWSEEVYEEAKNKKLEELEEEQEVLLEELSEKYIEGYPTKYIEGIIKAYETHKIEDGIFVLDNGGKTIAYGHDVREGEDFSDGLSLEDGLKLAIKDLDEKNAVVVNKVNELNRDYKYEIDINGFTENERMFLVDFVYNRGSGLVNREADSNGLRSSLAILIVAIAENDDERIRSVLMEEIYNLDGEKLDGLVLRRMDEYEMLRFGDYERDYDIERDYTQPKK